jgi:O-antigen ligase
MSRTWRLEHAFALAAIFLAGFTEWRLPAVNFNLSDMLFCVSILLLALSARMPRLPLHDLTCLWYVFFGTFLAFLILSSLVSGDPLRALVTPGQYLFCYALIPLTLMERGAVLTIRFLKTFVASMMAICLLGLFFFYFTDTTSVLGHNLISGSDRLASVLGNANAFAGMIGLTFPVVLYLWTSDQLPGLIVLPGLCVLGAALVASSSVSGLATTALGIVIFLMASGTVGWGRMAAGVGLAAGLVLLFVWWGDELPPTFQRRVLEPLQSGNLESLGTYSARMSLIHEAIGVLDQSLILGIGADQFRTESDLEAPVHNLYLLIWVEGGLPALVAWLGVLAVGFAAAARGLSATDRATRRAGALALSVMLLFSVISFNSAHVYARFRVVPLFLCLALVLETYAEERARRAPSLPGPTAATGSSGPRLTRPIPVDSGA